MEDKPETQPEQKVEEKVEEKVEKKEGEAEVAKEEDDFVVNPYTISSSNNKEIDYNKLIDKFGCYPVQQNLIDRIEKLTKRPAHYFIRRGIFFSHRDLDLVLTAYEKHT